MVEFCGQASKSKDKTIIDQEKEQVEMAYVSVAINKLGDSVTGNELQDELNNTVGKGKTSVTYNADTTLNVLFIATEHNFNVNNGKVKKIDVDTSTIAMFDTGTNVTQKMYALAAEGQIQFWYFINNLSIDGIKRYNGTPDLSSMTEANIVSWSDAYSAYEQNPSNYKDIVPDGTRLCPIYMWFEESGTEEIRSMHGDVNLTEVTHSDMEKNVKTGTIYWWCESNNVYLNPDSSNMFLGLSYLSDISGLQSLKTNYTTNMSNFLSVMSQNKKLKNFDALSGWNISNVTDLSNALCGYKNLENINGLKYWDTSKVEKMSGLFGNPDMNNTKINDLTALSDWNVSNVTDMSYLFYGCDITNLSALSNWDVSNVTNMQNMFYGCSKLTDASGINDWNIVNVINFGYMFYSTPTHPEFTKVIGTWDDNGTFNLNT
ncbi:MAG: BspA family leucine-rich repeat surface protein [Clostridia bacterium]